MPLRSDIHKVLVIGSGPIVIGQAAEFDYAGTQACRALREDGLEIVLINSNPATIMTDNIMADHIYIEPLTLETVKRVIKKERPDSILSGLGGQTGLTLSMQLARSGFLEENGVKLLGASPETIDKAEDRQMFKDTMAEIGEPTIASEVVTDVENALRFAKTIGYPVIVRPAFTLGGSGGGIAHSEEQLRELSQNGLMLSPIHQILVEKCISGWKEIEFEVMRDSFGNVITICSMENLDPVGVHTGDSIVIAPCVSLADREYQMLRTAALNIIAALGVEGGCNCQFALHPDSFEYAVIEVNPRVSRSSALASKATGYPIAKIATKMALGYSLDEIVNTVTGKTYCSFEPSIDYVAVKFPKWPFDKFVYAKRELGTQMKATGEVMTMADNFEMAIMKAVRGAEIGLDTLDLPKLATLSDDDVRDMLRETTDERLFVVFEALKRGVPVDDIYDITKIDRWFLYKLGNLVDYQKELQTAPLTEELYRKGKQMGYTDKAIKTISGADIQWRLPPTYKMVDTCAAEFSAETPYFYATCNTPESGGENEALDHIGKSGKETVIVLGSGPIRIGQGIEFDYASVQCVRALKKLGYEVVLINNNPETVSTDFDTSDRLYFEPLTPEDVMNVIEIEKPVGVVVAFGGQTAIRLTKHLDANGIRIIGASADCIDMAEDRERFDSLLESLQINRPRGFTVFAEQEALEAAAEIGYPVLMRPSYVLGGQNMIIAYSDEDIKEYMAIILEHEQEDNPVLIDKYLSGIEIEVDAICDGTDILIPGIMEHIERTGVHSGDSIAMYPTARIDDEMSAVILDTTEKISRGLGAIGLMNIQYIIMDGQLYVIEVNPRASRTVPYMSKVTGVPMCELATRTSLGEKLSDLGYGTGIYPASPYTAVKVPVFSFEKLTDVDTQLGPEMKSTGEVLGIGKNLQEALCKGLIAAGYKMQRDGGVFLTVRDTDKAEIAEIAKKFDRLGFSLYATEGTAKTLADSGLTVSVVEKIHKNSESIMDLLQSGDINYIISTSTRGRDPARDSVKIRRKASLLGIPCLTSIDTASALADSLMSRYSEINTELVDVNDMRAGKVQLPFIKMEAAGNDYIYIDCLNRELNSPESLSVFLSDRHYGVGGDGIVLICPSDVADAKMRMFNLDGSEGAICGNAIRCVGKYLYDNGIVPKTEMDIETLSGIRHLSLITKNNRVFRVSVHMGNAALRPEDIPVTLDGDRIVGRTVRLAGIEWDITCVSMGNPHCVLFFPSADAAPVIELGSLIEHDQLFPERVNVEFVQVIDRQTIRMRVWERGSGETMACGTGACAAAVAAILNGHCDADKEIRVLAPGGELMVRYTDDQVIMTGGAAKVYDGTVEI